VALFIAIAVHTWFIKKDRAEKLSKLPLDDDEEDTDLDQKQV
jgi:hypothetical protein